MKTIRLIFCAVTLLSAALLCSCSDVPFTGRSQLNLIPDSSMNTMATQQYQQFLGENKKSVNTKDVQMVQRVGLKISDAVEKYCQQNNMADRVAGYSWEFNLIESKEVNAWAMPGGKVVIYTGILPLTKDETGLAVVMGHEIAHVIARHGNERMSQGLLIEFGGMALSEALASKPAATKDLFMQSYGLGSQIGLLLPYSRLHESEADRIGLTFTAMAGYDPRAAVEFWQRMANQPGNAQKPPEFLSTHPADSTRITNIQKCLPEAMYYYHSPQAGAVPQQPAPPKQNPAVAPLQKSSPTPTPAAKDESWRSIIK